MGGAGRSGAGGEKLADAEVIESPFGRYYEEFEVGQVFKHWPGRTITEFDDTLFCMLTMNHHPMHIDAHFAESTQHGQRLVVGTLVFSLVVGMTVRDLSGKGIANLDYDEVRHLGPTWHGDTLYAESTVIEMRESQSKPDRGIVRVETRGINQRGEVILTLKRRILVPKRPGAG